MLVDLFNPCEIPDTTVGAVRHTPFSFPDPAPPARPPPARHSVRDPLKNADGGRARARTHARTYKDRARVPPVYRVDAAAACFARARRLEKNETEVTLSGRKQGKPVRERVS